MRARIVLLLANIKCELREVRLNNKPKQMLQASPKGTVPVMVIENKIIDLGSVLNGAKIGNGCLIGANSLITEGMEVPDGSVVMGSPGKIRSTLDEEQRKGLIMSAHHYVENYKRFKKELKKVRD